MEEGKEGGKEVNSIFVGCCSVAQSCPTLCDPMDYSTPGLPVLHHLDPTQTHVHWVGDAIQHTSSNKNRIWAFPDGSVVKKPPANAGDTGWISDPERSHMPRVTKSMCHNYSACVWSLRTAAATPVSHNYCSLSTLEPVLCNKRSPCNEKSMHRN